MAEIKLKPCPFCGEIPAFEITAHIKRESYIGVSFNIRCRKCNFDFPGKYEMGIVFNLNNDNGIQIICDERQKAADAWNRRANENV